MNKENIYTDKDDNIKKDVNPGNTEEFMSEESYIQSQIESPFWNFPGDEIAGENPEDDSNSVPENLPVPPGMSPADNPDLPF